MRAADGRDGDDPPGYADMEATDAEDCDMGMVIEESGIVKDLLRVHGKVDLEELQAEEREILKIIREMGGSSRRYMREQRKQTRWLLTEVYSPPRVTACAKLMPSFRIAPGLAMDLTTVDEEGVAWDFDRPERREAARARIAREKPMFFIGSPMCTAFSAWQHLNRERRDPALMQREYNKAMIHLEFVCKLYRDQADAGRYFLHEHPVAASSWQERCVAELLEAPGVFELNGDQCQSRRHGTARL